MRSKRFSRKDLLSSCDAIGPEDGADPRDFFRKSSGRVTNRKALQLCGQIARTLSLVLAGECGDDVLRELSVESVRPAPNSARLLITLSLPRGSVEVEEVMGRLQRVGGMLRSEVAAAINRRKTPELMFRVVQAEV
jgi:ribosome-binding factor A